MCRFDNDAFELFIGFMSLRVKYNGDNFFATDKKQFECYWFVKLVNTDCGTYFLTSLYYKLKAAYSDCWLWLVARITKLENFAMSNLPEEKTLRLSLCQ